MISVIIPVYNVENYLRDCLNSLKNQTYKNFEVIMVNDGSTDSSGEICKEYTCDSRFRFFNIPNGGVSNARNVALKHANGEMISFLDSDDMYASNFLEIMYEIKVKENADIVICDTKPFVDTCDNFVTFDGQYKVVDEKELYHGIFITNRVGGFVCNKLFDRRVLDNVLFDTQLSICEDMVFTMECVKSSERIIKIDSPLYQYRCREGSATRNFEKTFENGKSKYSIAYDKLYDKNLVNDKYTNMVSASICLICVGQKCDYKNHVEVVNKMNIRNINKVINKNLWAFIVSKEFNFKKKVITILNHLFNIRRFRREKK